MADQLVTYTHETGIATITLCGDSRGNAINADMLKQLATGVEQARRDRAAVVVLRASGRFFCVGGDLGAFETADADDLPTYVEDLAESLHRVVLDLNDLDAVVITAVQGAAAGAGFPLAAAGDIVLASATASFTLGYTKVGLTPDGGTSLLQRSLGLHRVLHLALTNATLTAAEAHGAGLVTQLAAPEELDDLVDRLAHQLAEGSSTAQAGTKRLIRQAFERSAPDALRAETVSLRAHAATSHSNEGILAFIEKRTPRFTN